MLCLHNSLTRYWFVLPDLLYKVIIENNILLHYYFYRKQYTYGASRVVFDCFLIAAFIVKTHNKRALFRMLL